MWQRIIKGRLIQPTSTTVGAVTIYDLPIEATLVSELDYSATYVSELNYTGVYDND